MSANGATVQGESYVYGGVLFQRVAEADERSQRTGIAACLSQGLLTGAVLMFLVAWFFILGSNDGNRVFIALYFPVGLSFSLVCGFVEGFVMGVCIKLRGHDLRWFTRAFIGALIFAVPIVALTIVFNSSDWFSVLTRNLIALVICSAAGAIFGIFTGSGLRVWDELVRGVDGIPRQSWFLTGLSGVVLRSAIVLFLMESVLVVIALSLSRTVQRESGIALLVLVHFIAAFVVAFGRLRLSFLLPLAFLINLPIAALFAYMLKEIHVYVIYLSIGYLGAWAAFLIARCGLTYRMLDSLKEEAKYYLID